ncbi:MAG: hypothetical protein ACOX7R_03005 [Acetivibrionales bacterium]|jgi:hypothetical protein
MRDEKYPFVKNLKQSCVIMAKKKYIHIYQCKSGDILADDIYDNFGILIMPKDAVINDYCIKRMKTFRVRQLSVYE